ncbi:hypothetical protein [Nocardiopsis protaetiae]|uniref:hypothetical protein n=1 Tax=Nocardiopsis protaetiae TaxID=3382270 RepID=UPI00387B1FC0
MSTTAGAEATGREENNAALITALRMKTPGGGEPGRELEIVNDTERDRWIAVLGADGIGELTYRFVGGRVVLLPARVDAATRACAPPRCTGS